MASDSEHDIRQAGVRWKACFRRLRLGGTRLQLSALAPPSFTASKEHSLQSIGARKNRGRPGYSGQHVWCHQDSAVVHISKHQTTPIWFARPVTDGKGFSMNRTLTHLNQAPDWLLHLFDEIDELDFEDSFDHFLPAAELQFGTAHIKGFPAIKDFFVTVDGPINIKHHVLDFWDGGNIKIMRGEATIPKKEGPATVVVPPLMNIPYMSDKDEEKVARWLVMGGPVNPEHGI